MNGENIVTDSHFSVSVVLIEFISNEMDLATENVDYVLLRERAHNQKFVHEFHAMRFLYIVMNKWLKIFIKILNKWF